MQIKYLAFICIMVTLQSFAQTGTIEGRVIYKVDSSALPGAVILVSGTGMGAVAGQDGLFTINDVPPGRYDITVQLIGSGTDTLRNVNIPPGVLIAVNLSLPPGDCSGKKHRICPVDMQSNEIIPIVYGLPGSKLRRKAERGKVWLGGCELTGCDPTWYCKRHKNSF
jgi:hypothetical protein